MSWNAARKRSGCQIWKVSPAPTNTATPLSSSPATLRSGEAADFDGVGLARIEDDLERLADTIAGRYFPNGPHALRPEKLAGLA